MGDRDALGLTSPTEPAQAGQQDDDKEEEEPSQSQAPIEQVIEFIWKEYL